jgi:Uma2 family endonuclease
MLGVMADRRETVVRFDEAAGARATSDRWRLPAGTCPSSRATKAVPPRRAPKMQCYDATETTVAATTTRRPATEDDLLAMPDDGQKYELVDGEIRVSPVGDRHGYVAAHLVALLFAFVKRRRLGYVMTGEADFRLPSKNVRCPDVSFVASGRFPKNRPPDDFGDLAPDLAVEVLSPRDRPRYVLDKVGEYLEAGVRLIWVIDPKKGRATVYRSLSDVRKLGGEDWLDGEDVLPGFRCRLRDILD